MCAILLYYSILYYNILCSITLHYIASYHMILYDITLKHFKTNLWALINSRRSYIDLRQALACQILHTQGDCLYCSFTFVCTCWNRTSLSLANLIWQPMHNQQHSTLNSNTDAINTCKEWTSHLIWRHRVVTKKFGTCANTLIRSAGSLDAKYSLI